MALYSVWDWSRNAWRVYETPASVSIGDDPSSPKPIVSNPIGADPDTQVRPLPSGARVVGYSHLARGEIRREPSSLLSGLEASDVPFWKRPLVMFGAGVAATVGWLWWRKRGS